MLPLSVHSIILYFDGHVSAPLQAESNGFLKESNEILKDIDGFLKKINEFRKESNGILKGIDGFHKEAHRFLKACNGFHEEINYKWIPEGNQWIP